MMKALKSAKRYGEMGRDSQRNEKRKSGNPRVLESGKIRLPLWQPDYSFFARILFLTASQILFTSSETLKNKIPALYIMAIVMERSIISA